MITSRIIDSEKASEQALQALKSYAGISDDSQDYLLTSMLNRAFLKVQEYEDVALLASTIEVTVTDKEDEFVKLYQGAAEILSVTNAEGAAITHKLISARQLRVSGSVVKVTYTTEPTDENYQYLLPVVLRYATALYDGADVAELNKILWEG